MLILHTSDWHLGRSFNGISLEADHEHILAQVLTAVTTHKPEVLIIAGDIYDRASPPEYALAQFRKFMGGIAQTDTAVVLIAGNHDSPERIAMMDIMPDRKRVLIRGPLCTEEAPLILNDSDGPVAFSALPFAYEYAARECFSSTEISSPHDVLAQQIKAARQHITKDMRWVVTAHAFVAGSFDTDSEKRLNRIAGNLETVAPSVFEGAHYVALGHLHRSQQAGAPHIRYSGSPLPFGFDEEGSEKSMTLIDLNAQGATTFKMLPFTLQRQVRVITGRYEEIIGTGEPSNDFVKIVLTDDDRKIDPMKSIRKIYPNAGPLIYQKDQEFLDGGEVDMTKLETKNPKEMVSEFLVMSRGEAPTEAEAILVDRFLDDASTAGASS